MNPDNYNSVMVLVRSVLIRHRVKTVVRGFLIVLWAWIAVDVVLFLRANVMHSAPPFLPMVASPFVLYMAVRNFIHTIRRGY